MTSAVAEFFEVPVETIRSTVNRNREEFDGDGYRVIERAEVSCMLKLTPDELGIPRNAGSVALFPRRAVLRIAMLLRDSEVARKVRDYLLDTEQSSREVDLTDPDVALDKIIELATLAKVERAGRLAAQAQIEADRPLVERAKNHAAGKGEKTRQQFFRELKQWARDVHGVAVKQDETVVASHRARCDVWAAVPAHHTISTRARDYRRDAHPDRPLAARPIRGVAPKPARPQGLPARTDIRHRQPHRYPGLVGGVAAHHRRQRHSRTHQPRCGALCLTPNGSAMPAAVGLTVTATAPPMAAHTAHRAIVAAASVTGRVDA